MSFPSDDTPATPSASTITDEMLGGFLGSPAPREIPPALRKAALRSSAPLAVGILGLIFFLFGLPFLWFFFPWTLPREWSLARSHVETRGQVVDVAETNMSINNVRVMRYTFEFSPVPVLPEKPGAGGNSPAAPAVAAALLSGECFTTGQRWQPGAVVTVRHHPADPSLACIEGARLSRGSAASGFVVIFPAVGACFIWFCIRSRQRVLWLLRHGTLGDFRIVAIDGTNTRINNRQVFRVTLRPEDRPEAPSSSLRLYLEKPLAFVRTRKKSGKPVFGLYDARRPRGNRVLLPEMWLE
ncbi:MAG: DUF3592 domain-containing protein [Opitutaceae bacterium]|jgi:hypothetical protein|nr:DUF3592 domain-containing protein [Opitutaceae bacterium]